MQDHHGAEPPQQLLRESYLAEARAQQRHSDMSRSDSSSSRRLVYGGLKGQAEEPEAPDERPGPDLSAFLSQEELDESVNLACQAIGHKPREERAAERKAPRGAARSAPTAATPSSAVPTATVCSAPSSSSFPVAPSASSSSSFTVTVPPSSSSSFTVPPSAPSSSCFTAPPSSSSSFTVPPSAPSSSSFSVPPSSSSLSVSVPHSAPSPPSSSSSSSSFAVPPPSSSSSSFAVLPPAAPVRKEPSQPPHAAAFRADTKSESAPALAANGMSHSKPPGGAPAPAPDPARPARGPPGFGVENQSKKEFLNKAADFIEELSSLFKANSTKRVRPQGSGRKTHKSRTQKDPEDRDRPVEAPGPPEEAAVESRRPSPGSAPYPPEREAVQPLPPQQDGPAGGAQQTHGDPPSQQVEVEEEEEEGGQREEEEEQEQPEGEAGRPAPTDPPYSEEPVCEPPCFVQKLKSREVLEGSKVQLDCTVTGLPVPEVRWFCEGKELENSPDIQILTLAGRHSLVIAEAFEEDTGRYSCFASNYYGTDSTSAEIYVEGASSTDSEGELPVEHVPRQVQKAQPHPAAPSPPAAQPAADVGADDSDASSQTTINSTTSTAEDQPYQHPPVGTQREESPVQPEAPPPAPECSPTTATPFLYEEPSEAPVAPPPCAPVPPPAEPQEEPVPEPLPGAGPQPLGLVELNPAEAYGQGAPSQTLTVENQNSTQLSHQEQDVRPIMAAPVFTKSLQEVSALEGQLVVLECRMKGVPSPRVEWYREGTVIEDSPDFRILQKKPRSHSESEEICTLVIAEVFPEDSGMFTCTASNKYGTVSSLGRLRVKGNVRGGGVAVMESGQVRESFLPDVSAAVQHHPEVTVTTSVKPHSSSVRLEPLSSSSIRLEPLSCSTLRLDPLSSSTLRLDPLSSSTLRLDPLSCSTLRLDPLSSSTLRLDPLSSSMSGSVSLPSLDPQALGGSSRERISYTSTPRLDPQYLTPQHLNPPGSGESAPEPLGVDHGAPFYLKPFAPPSEPEPPPYRPAPPAPAAPEGPPPKVRAPPAVVPLPDPPANSCLKSSAPTNPREPRPSAKAGLRVTFRLPEDEEEEEPCDPSDWPYEEGLTARGPPPVLTKPKLDPAQLQILRNQVLLEQQQDGDSHSHSKARPQSPPWTQSQPPSQSQYQPAPQSQSLSQSQPPSQSQYQPPPQIQSQTQSQPVPHTQSQYQPPPQALSQSQPQIYSQYQPPPQAQSLTQSQPLPQGQSQYQPAPYTQSFTQCQPPAQSQVQPQSQPQISSESVVWSPRLPREPTLQHFQLYTNTAVTTQSQVPVSAYTMAHTAVTTSQVPVSAYTMAHTAVTTSQVPVSAYTMAHTAVTPQSQVPVSAYTMAHTAVTTSQVPVSAYTMAHTAVTTSQVPVSAYTMAHTAVTTQSQVPVSAYTMAHTAVTTSQVPVSAYTMAPTMPTLTSGPAATLPTAPAAQPNTVPAPAPATSR
ncbi:myopalladin-like, partial [Gadus chalcogrammus]|uniref:myopalladin-like n=1 Tax=Gadus chalcogrammus TaxID=1042646 RepID=UPI0024C4ADE9